MSTDYKGYFEHLGYFKEFYIGSKFIGFLECDKDRDVMGYNGRTEETTANTIVLENNKKIKAGTKVMTMLYPLSGKVINK